MIREGGLSGPDESRLGFGKPSTREVSQAPSTLRRMTPNEIPFEVRSIAPPGGVASRRLCSSSVICRASISTKPDPFMPTVLRSLEMEPKVTKFPASSMAPRVIIESL